MTVVYVDTLFLLNAAVDYLLLLCAAKVAGEPLRRSRFALGALLGGVYAVALFLPGLGFLQHPLCRLATGVLMVLCAFSGTRRLLRQTLIFAALACAFGGGVLAVSLLGGRGLALGNGVFYTVPDLKIVLLSAAGCYAGLTLVFRRWGRHTAGGGELSQVRLCLDGRSVTLTALSDTGNTLSDPISGRAALVAEGERLLPLFPDGVRPEAADLADPVGGLERLSPLLPGRFRLLPYRAVGISRGLLLAVRVDRVETRDETARDALVALSPTPVSDGGAYQVLVGAE